VGRLGTLVHAFVVAALVGKVLANLRDMGLPIPVMLTDTPKAKTTASP
jgi:phage-related holin